MRPCLVLSKDKSPKKAMFHMWEQFANVIAPAMMIGGHQGGQVAEVFAIVEYADGSVAQVYPTNIKFVDTQDEISSHEEAASLLVKEAN